MNAASLAPEALYNVLAHAVQPRAVVLISTTDGSGAVNFAPFSFLTVGGFNPPSLVFSITTGTDGHLKETLLNMDRVPEFTVGTVDRTLAVALGKVGFRLPHSVEAFEGTDFSVLPSDLVQPVYMAQSPLSFECRVHERVSHGDQPGSGHYVIGEIVAIHLREGLSFAPDFSIPEYHPVSRLGGAEYLDLESLERFMV